MGWCLVTRNLSKHIKDGLSLRGWWWVTRSLFKPLNNSISHQGLVLGHKEFIETSKRWSHSGVGAGSPWVTRGRG